MTNTKQPDPTTLMNALDGVRRYRQRRADEQLIIDLGHQDRGWLDKRRIRRMVIFSATIVLMCILIYNSTLTMKAYRDDLQITHDKRVLIIEARNLKIDQLNAIKQVNGDPNLYEKEPVPAQSEVTSAWIAGSMPLIIMDCLFVAFIVVALRRLWDSIFPSFDKIQRPHYFKAHGGHLIGIFDKGDERGIGSIWEAWKRTFYIRDYGERTLLYFSKGLATQKVRLDDSLTWANPRRPRFKLETQGFRINENTGFFESLKPGLTDPITDRPIRMTTQHVDSRIMDERISELMRESRIAITAATMGSPSNVRERTRQGRGTQSWAPRPGHIALAPIDKDAKNLLTQTGS